MGDCNIYRPVVALKYQLNCQIVTNRIRITENEQILSVTLLQLFGGALHNTTFKYVLNFIYPIHYPLTKCVAFLLLICSLSRDIINYLYLWLLE